MYCRVLACDFDGTGATDGRLAAEVVAALGKARAQGVAALLVTGRVLEDVEALCGDLSIFDAVVAENGAVVCLPQQQRIIQLGAPPSERFLGELRARGVPFHVGAVIVGSWDRHASEVLELIRRLAIDGQLIFNREAMMVLPTGINKAIGTSRALEELGRSERNMIAFGDAENDLPLFALAEIGVAARGALPVIAQQADDRLAQPGGAGVAHYIHRLLEQGGILPSPPRRRFVLGRDLDGEAVSIPGSGINLMITGDPRSGKSWLAGLVAEQLVDQRYRLVVIDPEGDYLSLGERPRVLSFGNDLALPEPTALPRILREDPVSLVLSLASLSQDAQARYVEAALSELELCCTDTGIPQWILVDEAQYFFHEPSPRSPRFTANCNFLFTTYRPSLVSNSIFAAVKGHLITHTTVEEERYFITSLLRTYGPPDVVVSEALRQIELPRAGLLLEDPSHPRWQVFTPGARVTAHAHHARKYADTRLAEDKAFRFLYANGVPLVAHNMMEFHTAIQSAPMASLRHHLARGDFSRWVADVIGDQELARGLHKIERAVIDGAAPDRAEILAHIEDQYRM
jgi:hydroxymethylpyrimidine pyrophosphatase-like HAD family hydrolase